MNEPEIDAAIWSLFAQAIVITALFAGTAALITVVFL